MDELENNKKSKKIIVKIFAVIIIMAMLIVGVAGVIKIAPNYKDNSIKDKVNLIINFSNVTGRMKNDLIVDDNGVIYLSFNDIMNYYDDNIYYDKQYSQIVTSSENKLAVLKVDSEYMEVNGDVVPIKGGAILREKVYYLPISEMEEVYDIKVKKTGNNVVIESLDRKYVTGVVGKNVTIRTKTNILSRGIEKISKGEKVGIAENADSVLPNGWIRVRTENGNIGYMEEKYITAKTVEREDKTITPQIEGKISLAWDYFSEYAKAPDNTGIKYDGVNVVSPSFFYMSIKDMQKPGAKQISISEQAKIHENVGEAGEKYIKWARDNGYKVWPKVSNETLSSTIDEFSEIIGDYELRKSMINDIVGYVRKYDLDGINLDFEYMYEDDKDNFNKFVIELAPQLRDIGACLSVDVTAPDGSSSWSLCYDRHTIGEVADYVVFMGYDQYGTNSIGTTSGYNWVNISTNKFLTTEEIPSEKLILALPFYTKLWKTRDGQTVGSNVVTLNDIENKVPSNVEKKWLDELQQYYIEYTQGGYVYKMWIEDQESFAKKLKLVNEKNLAGAAYWRKGFDSKKIWDVIEAELGVY